MVTTSDVAARIGVLGARYRECVPEWQARLAAAGIAPGEQLDASAIGRIAVLPKASLATRSEGETLHFHADLIAEIVDPSDERLSDGQVGELVASLDNPGFPLLRFGTGDLVQIDARPCACGRGAGFRVLGRVGASVRVKGMLLHQDQLCGVLKKTDALACRIEVTRARDRDSIEPFVKPGTADLQALADAFRSQCHFGADRIALDATLADGDCLVADLGGG